MVTRNGARAFLIGSGTCCFTYTTCSFPNLAFASVHYNLRHQKILLGRCLAGCPQSTHTCTMANSIHQIGQFDIHPPRCGNSGPKLAPELREKVGSLFHSPQKNVQIFETHRRLAWMSASHQSTHLVPFDLPFGLL